MSQESARFTISVLVLTLALPAFVPSTGATSFVFARGGACSGASHLSRRCARVLVRRCCELREVELGLVNRHRYLMVYVLYCAIG